MIHELNLNKTFFFFRSAMEFNLEGKKVTLNEGRGLFINAHYKVILTQKQREHLWLSTSITNQRYQKV